MRRDLRYLREQNAGGTAVEENLFADSYDPNVTTTGRLGRTTKAAPDFSEPSPFGAYKPESLPPPEKGGGFGQAFDKGAPRKKPSKPREHYPRVRKYMVDKFGGFFYTCDGFKAGAGGQLVSTDLLGFMDIQGFPERIEDGRMIGVNVTSKEAVGAHLRDYTNRSNTHGQAKIPVPDLIREFLTHGNRFVILGYEKVGARWLYHETWVTEALMAEYEARKRSRK